MGVVYFQTLTKFSEQRYSETKILIVKLSVTSKTALRASGSGYNHMLEGVDLTLTVS
jgi:hypothetical protein